jgi:hypothetical protein
MLNQVQVRAILDDQGGVCADHAVYSRVPSTNQGVLIRKISELRISHISTVMDPSQGEKTG